METKNTNQNSQQEKFKIPEIKYFEPKLKEKNGVKYLADVGYDEELSEIENNEIYNKYNKSDIVEIEFSYGKICEKEFNQLKPINYQYDEEDISEQIKFVYLPRQNIIHINELGYLLSFDYESVNRKIDQEIFSENISNMIYAITGFRVKRTRYRYQRSNKKRENNKLNKFITIRLLWYTKSE
jgi:hypothetical protein